MIMRFVLATIFFFLSLIFISVGVDKIKEWKDNRYKDNKAKLKLVTGIVLIGLAVSHSFIIIPIIFRM